MVMLPCPGCPPAFWGCGVELAAHTGLESQGWGTQCLPGEEMLHVWGWAEALPVWEL